VRAPGAGVSAAGAVSAGRPGRPAAATRQEVLALATARYLAGERIDVQAIAAELSLARATVYRWFGSRDELIGEVIATEGEALVERTRRRVGGHGPSALLETFDRINHALVAAAALRALFEQDHGGALRIITSSAGTVHPRMVAAIEALVRTEAGRDGWHPSADPQTLAYAIVRLAEGFLYSDVGVGIRGDVDRLREVEAALLGISPG
jgi:AcrR family transcriptional regulator